MCRAVGAVLHADEQDFGNLPEYPSSVSVPPVGDIFDAVDLSHLDPAQQQQLLAVLRRHVSVFSDAPGRCTVGEHVIQLVDGAVPRRRAPYRIPESLRAEVDRQIDQLLEDGLITEITSPWCHSIVCVEKPGKTLRLCVDYREVNKYTVADSYPMPRVDSMLDQMSRGNYIASLDASSGFWQIAVSPESIDKTPGRS